MRKSSSDHIEYDQKSSTKAAEKRLGRRRTHNRRSSKVSGSSLFVTFHHGLPSLEVCVVVGDRRFTGLDGL